MLKYGIYSVQDGSKLVRILVGLFIVASILYFLFGRHTAAPHKAQSEQPSSSTSSRDRSHRTDMSKVNLIAPPIPDDIIAKSRDKHNIITEGTVTVQGCEVFFRETIFTSDPKETVLLLHGAAFSSATWEKLNTLQLLAAMGHHAVAIDIPGYGESKGAVKDPVAFLEEVLSLLKLHDPVIVSPSMSGKFSLPFLMEYPEKVKGFIPVAPVGTGTFVDKYPSVKVATAIVYGSSDTRLGQESLDNLRALPNSVVVRLPEAGHAAYMDKPDLWHTILYNFLQAL